MLWGAMTTPISLSEFAQNTEQTDRNFGIFELENPKLLEVRLNGSLFCKTGSMVARYGDIQFAREGMLDHGIGHLLKKTFTGENFSLMRASGQGRLYLADSAKDITLISLEEQCIHINGNDLLAFETTLQHDIQLTKSLAGVLAGGLFHVRLKGTGLIALTTHGRPLTLSVDPSEPLYTDPQTTVAWSENLKPEIESHVNLKTLLGRGTGEAFQMRFEGNGFVIIQPCEGGLPAAGPR
jgi:uncharacterized protein (AIM24 family)